MKKKHVLELKEMLKSNITWLLTEGLDKYKIAAEIKADGANIIGYRLKCDDVYIEITNYNKIIKNQFNVDAKVYKLNIVRTDNETYCDKYETISFEKNFKSEEKVIESIIQYVVIDSDNIFFDDFIVSTLEKILDKIAITELEDTEFEKSRKVLDSILLGNEIKYFTTRDHSYIDPRELTYP